MLVSWSDYVKIKQFLLCAAVGLLFGCGGSEKTDPTPLPDAGPDLSVDSGMDANNTEREAVRLRIATFNTSLFRGSANALAEQLASASPQANEVAAILKLIEPDIVLLNEFDWDEAGLAVERFQARFLTAQGVEPYPHVYVASSNTGVPSGYDLDKNGVIETTPGTQNYGNDSFGYGLFEGQYSFVILSRFPIQGARTFQNFLWSDMPESMLPRDYYEDASDALRLSSKNHVDLSVDVNGRTLHVLASHPTPPAFDGPEDRNGKRNHDEIRLWLDYINNATYLIDDNGAAGGLSPDDAFVIVGDLNADPNDGDAERGALLSLLAHERVQDTQPKSQGAVEKAASDGRANQNHTGDPALDTADFSDAQVGNLRVDYVLPSSHMNVLGSAVFWPAAGEEGADLRQPSDHHLVWVDVEF